jgi:hypothetical protein
MDNCKHPQIVVKHLQPEGTDPRKAPAFYYFQCKDCGVFKPAFADLDSVLRAMTSMWAKMK